jgi:hypothetical protein
MMSDWPSDAPVPGEKLIADGWVYRDLSAKLSFEMWEFFLNLVGDGNYRILATTEGPDWRHGQFLISPTGIARLRDYAKSAKAITMPIDELNASNDD